MMRLLTGSIGHAYGRWIFPPLVDETLQRWYDNECFSVSDQKDYYKLFLESIDQWYIPTTVPLYMLINGEPPNHLSGLVDPQVVCGNCMQVAPLNCNTPEEKMNFYFFHSCVLDTIAERKDGVGMISLDDSIVSKYIQSEFDKFSNNQQFF